MKTSTSHRQAHDAVVKVLPAHGANPNGVTKPSVVTDHLPAAQRHHHGRSEEAGVTGSRLRQADGDFAKESVLPVLEAGREAEVSRIPTIAAVAADERPQARNLIADELVTGASSISHLRFANRTGDKFSPGFPRFCASPREKSVNGFD